MAAPMFTLPGATTNYGTYTPPSYQALIPMPESIAKNINLGWNYATGQIVPPRSNPAPQLTPFKFPTLIQTQGVMPTTPRLANPATALPNQKYDWGPIPKPSTGIGALAQLINPVTAMSPKPAVAPTVMPKTTVTPKTAPVPVKAPVAVKTK